jgi:hypothetical protein
MRNPIQRAKLEGMFWGAVWTMALTVMAFSVLIWAGRP